MNFGPLPIEIREAWESPEPAAELTETIQSLGADFVITQGTYSLTADAMQLRSQRPLVIGDDYTFHFTLLNTDGTPRTLDPDLHEITMNIKFSGLTGDALSLVKTASISTDSEEPGQFDVLFERSDVANVDMRFGFYNLKLIARQGAAPWYTYTVETLLSGDIELLPCVGAR